MTVTEQLKERLISLIEAQDLDGIHQFDAEVRAVLEDPARKMTISELKELNELYSGLKSAVGKLRNNAANKAKGLHSNRKGIDAYKSS